MKGVYNSSKLSEIFSFSNEYFKDFSEHIDSNIMKPIFSADSKYRKGEDKKLLNLCRQHIRENYQQVSSENVIMFVHPFYLHQGSMNGLNTFEKRISADNYLGKLKEFYYNNNINAEKVNFETIHSYAKTAFGLLENGKIDDVVLTKYDSGEPLVNRDLKKYKGKNIFISGMYNTSISLIKEKKRLCLDKAIESIVGILKPKECYMIKDFVLNSPSWCSNINFTDDDLIPVGSGFFPKNRVVSLEEAVGMLKK